MNASSSNAWLLIAFLANAFLLATAASCGGGGGQAQGACPNDLPPACPSNPPTFTADVQPVVASRCGLCHGPSGVEPTHPFQTYAQIFSQRATILGQLHGCRMPPADAPQPTAAERQVLLGWLVCGAPND